MKELTDKVLANKSLSILGIILLAVFFRFLLLSSTPPGLYPDVAMNGMDAIHANETGDYKIFYPANNGREGLFINLDAFVFKVFGTGLWQIRFAGAVIGVLTVLGIYFLGKEMFGKKVGVFASLFMATSFWAVNFSRIGFRAVMVPLILVWGSYFLLKAFNLDRNDLLSLERNRELNSWTSLIVSLSRRIINSSYFYYLLAGAIFGLGFHTYIAYKAAVLIFPIIFGYKIFFEKGYLKKSWIKILFFGMTLTVIAFPVLYYQQTHKGDAARTGQVSVFNPAVNKGNFIKTISITTAKGLGMYNFYGDPNERHNYKGLPALNPLVGIVFLVGLYFSIKIFITKIKKRDGEFFNFSFLVFSFFIMMLPSILTEEGMPHSLRAIGTMPFAFLFAGLGAEKGLSFFKRKERKGLSFLIPAMFVFIVFFDFILYFQLWAKDKGVRGQFNSNYVEGSVYLNSLPQNVKKYVIVNTGGVEVDGLPVAAQTYKYVTYGKSEVEFLSEKEAEDFKVNFEKDSAIILAKKDDKLIKKLDFKCPNGSLYEYNPGEPIQFYVYKISKMATTCGGG